jgi:hypothetical protein
MSHCAASTDSQQLLVLRRNTVVPARGSHKFVAIYFPPEKGCKFPSDHLFTSLRYKNLEKGLIWLFSWNFAQTPAYSVRWSRPCVRTTSLLPPGRLQLPTPLLLVHSDLFAFRGCSPSYSIIIGGHFQFLQTGTPILSCIFDPFTYSTLNSPTHNGDTFYLD